MSVRRKNLAFRYMWTAWLYLARLAALVAMLACMVVAVVKQDLAWLLPAGVAAGILVVTLVWFTFEAPTVRCLGCGGTLLQAMRCGKHKTAKRVLGSYTLHCSLILATYARSVHCPYCGMRYRVARSTRGEQRGVEEAARDRQRAETAAEEARRRAEAESKKEPFY